LRCRGLFLSAEESNLISMIPFYLFFSNDDLQIGKELQKIRRTNFGPI
jgi:hypothetical protein